MKSFPISEFDSLLAMRSEFGQRLFAARKHAGLTQAKLAEDAGTSQANYAELEKKGQGSALTPAIAKRCGVSVDWLAYGEGEMLTQALSPPLLQNQPTFFSPTVTVGPPPLSDYARDLAVLFDRLTTTENRADVAEACRELIRIKAAESQSSAPLQSSRRVAG